MRLLYALPTLGARGGIDRSARRILGAMTRAGHQVSVVVPDFTLFPDDERVDGECLRFGAVEPMQPEAWVPWVTRAIERFTPELVVAYYGSTAGYAGVRAAKETGVPVVLSLRGNDVDRDREIPTRARRVQHAIEHATAVTCVSREMIGKVQDWCGVTPEFVINSVDDSEFFPDPKAGRFFRAHHGIGSDRPVLGLFGVFKPKRGIERLARLAETKRWHVILVGQVRPDVRDEVPREWQRIRYLESTSELRAAYAACDVVAQPSWMDGMPNVVLEAMACARTVIASPVGGMTDLIQSGENGVLCASDEEWSQQLADLRQRSRAELGVAARRCVPTPQDERLSFEEVFRRTRPE